MEYNGRINRYDTLLINNLEEIITGRTKPDIKTINRLTDNSLKQGVENYYDFIRSHNPSLTPIGPELEEEHMIWVLTD